MEKDQGFSQHKKGYKNSENNILKSSELLSEHSLNTSSINNFKNVTSEDEVGVLVQSSSNGIKLDQERIDPKSTIPQINYALKRQRLSSRE